MLVGRRCQRAQLGKMVVSTGGDDAESRALTDADAPNVNSFDLLPLMPNGCDGIADNNSEAGPSTARDLAKQAWQSNKDHQYALQIYTQRLEAELAAVDKLLVSVARVTPRRVYLQKQFHPGRCTDPRGRH